MKELKERRLKRSRAARRRLSTRRRIKLRSSRPRLMVYRSSKHIYAQVIDDEAGRTLAAAGTSAKAVSDELGGKTKSERAQWVGSEIARKAKEAGVAKVVFDRGPYKFHGRVKALAQAAREGGLVF